MYPEVLGCAIGMTGQPVLFLPAAAKSPLRSRDPTREVSPTTTGSDEAKIRSGPRK